jgi:hypothetical protein
VPTLCSGPVSANHRMKALTTTSCLLLLSVFCIKAHALDANDNLATWKEAPAAERATLAKSLVKDLPNPKGREPTLADTRFLINCLTDMAQGPDDKLPVKAVASTCWEMLR